MSRTPTLGERLSIIKTTLATASAIVTETSGVFRGKHNLFTGESRTVKAFEDLRAQELNSTSTRNITTTVPDRLTYTFTALANAIRESASIDAANRKAAADIILDDNTVLAKDVPVATLIYLEGELPKWKNDIFLNVPTLTPGVDWVLDADSGKNIYKSKHPVQTKKTEKKSTILELSPATKEHKAQVVEKINDVACADIFDTSYSGMITSADKEELLTKFTKFEAAVKQARVRANAIQAPDHELGNALLSYLLPKEKVAA
jgi:hypothetical protein